MERFNSFCAARRPAGNVLWRWLRAMAVAVAVRRRLKRVGCPSAGSRDETGPKGASAPCGGRARAAESVCTALEGRVLTGALGSDQHGIGFGSSRGVHQRSTVETERTDSEAPGEYY